MSTHEEMTDQITRILTASVLVEEEFPSESLLPRVAAIPYNNIGHQLLIDYRHAASVLWAAAKEIEQVTTRSAAPAFGSLGLAMLIWLLLAAAEWPIAGFFVGVAVGFVVYLMTATDLSKAAAEVKSRYVQQLLEGRDLAPPRAEIDGLPESKWVEFGDGMVGADRVPVFFANGPDDPFPGLGWLQARELFVCPRKEHDSEQGDERQLFEAVLASVERVGKALHNSYIGPAVVVDTNTVGPKSVWLDAEGRPRLSVPVEAGASPMDLSAFDPKASARAYAGLQVLFPRYMTCASVFVRPFLAEGSASFEILISTLGPATTSLAEIRRRVHVHEQAVMNESERKESDLSPDRSALQHQLHFLQILSENETDYLAAKSDFSDLHGLRVFDEDRAKEELEEAAKLSQRMDEWIGAYTRESNWRERNSLTVTRDFFGTSECKASVRAIYSLVSKDVLTAFEELGYDIGGYRDEAGHWTIQAEKIEQMVVGERISVSDGTKQAARSSTDAPSAEGAEA